MQDKNVTSQQSNILAYDTVYYYRIIYKDMIM